MSQQQEDIDREPDAIDRELEELIQDLSQRPIAMSDLSAKAPDTMEFGELFQEGYDPDDLT